LACLLIVAGLLCAVGLVSCGSAQNAVPLRATLPLPLPENASVHGSFVSRRLLVPRGYGSAGRPFYLHARSHGGPPEPLLLVLHGLYQTPAQVESATGAASYSERRHFTLVYPIGEHEAWNAGSCCHADTANDVGYLVDLVHYVATLTPVDLHRVYIAGFSNGGMMAWRAVCQTHDIFAGAGVMAGALLVKCPQPVHVIDLHGLRDQTVPYSGGYSHYTHTVIPDSARERRELAPGSTLDVVLLKRLGHAWPSLRGNFDALNVIWEGLHGYRVDHPATVASPALG
jgi:dienelactone hydrolase